VALRGVVRPPRLSSCKRGTPELDIASGSLHTSVPECLPVPSSEIGRETE
jgi:hypothetical protein